MEGSTILWLTGEAGSGKTVLTGFLIEELKAEIGPSWHRARGLDIVLSFFCAQTVESHGDARTLLKELILQLLTTRMEIIHRIKEIFGSSRHEYDASFETLWRIFQTAVELVPEKSIYIIVDGLDECEETSRSRLLSRLSRLIGDWSSDSRPRKTIKLVISGQTGIIAAWKPSYPSLKHYHIRLEDHALEVKQDISRFINHRVDELVSESIWTPKTGETLKQRLYDLAEHSFLWSDVVLNHMRTGLDYRDTGLKQVLLTSSKTLNDTYTRYLPALAASEIPRLRKYLQLIVACRRPLVSIEVDILTEIDNQLTTSHKEFVGESVTQSSIRRALGPLVKFPGGTAQFVHSTVKGYFLDIYMDPDHPLHTTHGIDLEAAHLCCARSCMEYLIHDDLPDDLFDTRASSQTSASPSSISMHGSRQSRDGDGFLGGLFDTQEVFFLQDESVRHNNMCEGIHERFKAYDYAATQWMYHYAQSEQNADDWMMRNAVMLLSCATARLSNWYRYKIYQSSTVLPGVTAISPIILSALFNHQRTLSMLLETRDSQVTKDDLLSALYWAAAKGNSATVKVLLEHGIDSIDCDRGTTSLAVAVQGGFETVCSDLLNIGGAGPNYFNPECRPPLILAAGLNHTKILRMLLHHQLINVDLADSEGRTALIEACMTGSFGCLQALIEDGRPNINATDCAGRTALIHASRCGNDSAVKSLIKKRSLQLHEKDKDRRNAVSYAAERGDLSIVRRLVRADASIAERDSTGRNAISWAAKSFKATEAETGEESVLEYLVRKCPNGTDDKDESGWSPLAWAMYPPGYLKSVKILVEKGGADLNQRDETSGRSVLAWAASEGFADITRYLLSLPGVDKNSMDKDNRTPLSYAAANGMLETVEALLADREVMHHCPDTMGRTPLDWARLNQHSTIVQVLEQLDSREP